MPKTGDAESGDAEKMGELRPLLGQEGWLRIKKMLRKPPLKAQTGWSFWTDHPVRALKDAFGDIF